MMSVVDLRKSFVAPNGERIEVLRGVTFEAKAGESIAITGASGSGKSTLLHLLGGLEMPDHGDITLAGQRKKIGFIFQFHYLLADLSAIENVEYPLLLTGMGKRERRARAMALLEAVGLADRGEIAPGKRADLIRVHVARDIPVVRSVWREGRRVA